MKRVTKYVFETSDGKAFDIREEAERHESELSLAAFFSEDAELGDETLITGHIIDNLDRFAEIIRPMIRKPRGSKATVAEYEEMLK